MKVAYSAVGVYPRLQCSDAIFSQRKLPGKMPGPEPQHWPAPASSKIVIDSQWRYAVHSPLARLETPAHLFAYPERRPTTVHTSEQLRCQGAGDIMRLIPRELLPRTFFFIFTQST